MRTGAIDMDVMTDYLAKQVARMSDRGLGDLQLQSNLAESAQSLATARGARNLLAKARRDLATSQVEHAALYIDRALRLPFNETAEAPTAAYEAHMILFTIVTDAFENSSEGDSSWLDAAEATLPLCGEHALEDLLQTLRTIDHDCRPAPSERRRIRAIAPGGAHADGVGDVILDRAGDGEAAQRVIITELLLATTDYEAELERRRMTDPRPNWPVRARRG
jgi:hypothetical protein